MTQTDNEATLATALADAGIELPEAQIQLMDQYRQILWRWNEKLNLTRHTTMTTFVERDVVDSLQLANLLAADEEVLDVGSGGGVPGILLAILRPDLSVHLSESMGKKAKVLDAIVRELNLAMNVHHGRAEKLLEDFRFDSIVARAVGPLWKICRWFEPYWAAIPRILLIKGPRWPEERAAARERGLLAQLELRRVANYPLAGTESESFILQLSRRLT